MLRIILLGLAVLTALSSVAYFTYFKTTPIGGERGVDPVWYSKNSFFVYISTEHTTGGFLPMDYVETTRIEGADYASFEYIADGLAKDKNNFYYQSSIRTKNPSNGTEHDILKAGKIENNKSTPLRVIDVDLAKNYLLYERYYIIGNSVIRSQKYIETSSNGSRVSRRVGLVNGIYPEINSSWYSFDYKTFNPFPCGYAKDKNGVYNLGFNPLLVIEGADIETFEVKINTHETPENNDPCIATDKNYLYFYSKGKDNVFEIGRKPLDNSINTE